MYPLHHNVKNGYIQNCQICNSKKLHKILDLGHQPLCDSLLTKETLNQPEPTYPLRMFWCEKCSLVQLDYCVDGSLVYHSDYPYRSGVTKELVEYQNSLSKSLTSKFNLNKKDLVIDLGSNDGTLLSGFKKQGISVVGVEPTNIAKIAQKNGIKTIQKFFNQKVSKEIKNKHGKASLIIATNMFAHMATIGEVVSGIEKLLKDDGRFVFENHYLLSVIEGGQFDTIYHEHLRTYSLKSLIKLFSYYNFTITDVERSDRYGGNIRVYVTKGKNKHVSRNVTDLLKLEEKSGLHRLETYKKFAKRVKKSKEDFLNFILKAKKEGKTIAANSCPGRSVTLLNYYGVDSDLIPYIAEQPASLKLGMYLPGKQIPIINNDVLLKKQPDYVILLAWHYAVPIMKQLRARGLKSNFVIPLPDLTIIKNSKNSNNIDKSFYRTESMKKEKLKIDTKKMYKFEKRCRLCKSKDFKLVLDLGEQPPSNALLSKKDLNIYEHEFPLRLFLCKNCYHLQLLDVVDKKYLFSNYLYITSANKTMVNHFKTYSEYLYQKFLKKTDNPYVIEIGSNDGTLLKNFLKHKVDVLGIEPAKNLANFSKKVNVKTITKFFDLDIAKKLAKKRKSNIIIANNVLGHVDNLNDFIKGVSVLLKDDGIFVFEVPHSYELLRKLEFDTIYHEHISYFSITPIQKWLKRNNLEVFDVKKEKVHGGTIRVFVSKIGKYCISKSVDKIIKMEKDYGMKSLKTYDNFSKEIKLLKISLRKMIFDLKDQGFNIFGYGAPAKGNVLLNYCDLDNKIIDFCVDVTSLKHNKLSPGTHIPIRSPKIVTQLSGNYVGLLLAWNYKNEILQKEMKFMKNGGKFLVPIPKPTLIS